LPASLAKATPNRPWPNADVCEVAEGETSHTDIPILRIIWTPATITIRRSQYPDGVVILNDNAIPTYSGSIDLPLKETRKDEEEIPVTYNGGWPNGHIVLFK
jgi:hypothetical protein